MTVMKVTKFPTNPDQVTFCQYCGEKPADLDVEFSSEHFSKTISVCRSCSVTIAEHGYSDRPYESDKEDTD